MKENPSAMHNASFIYIPEDHLNTFDPEKRQQALTLLDEVKANQQSLCYHCKKLNNAVRKRGSSFVLGAVSLSSIFGLIEATQIVGPHIHNDIDAIKTLIVVCPTAYAAAYYSCKGIDEYFRTKKYIKARACVVNRRLEKINETSLALIKDYGAKTQHKDGAPTIGFNELSPCTECVAVPNNTGVKSPALKRALKEINEKEKRPDKFGLNKLVPMFNRAP